MRVATFWSAFDLSVSARIINRAMIVYGPETTAIRVVNRDITFSRNEVNV